MSSVRRSKFSPLVLSLFLIGALTIMGCIDDPEPDPPPPPNCSDETVLPNGADFGEYFPDHVSGDCSFDNGLKMQGPRVNVKANLYVDESKTQLRLSCSMAAVEIGSDYTKAEGSWDELVYTAPEGSYISKISSVSSASGEYTDTNILWDKIETSMCTFKIMGNTLLNDVCNTIIDGDATRMKIHLNPISIVFCDQQR